MISRIYKFFKKHFFKNTRYLLWYTINYFNGSFINKINYFENEDIVSLLKSGKSLIRIGDGEVFLLNYGDIHYQTYSDNLRSNFLEMIKGYSDISPYVLCVNRLPLSKTNAELKSDGLLNCWLPMKVVFDLYFNKKAKYLDQAIFYYNETIPKYFETYLKQKKIIYVTNKKNINNIKNNNLIPFKNVEFVETPNLNSFDYFEKIYSEINTKITKEEKGGVVVILACGPASKVLGFRLSKDGIQAIDVGRGIEVAYTNSRIDQIVYPKLNISS
jgi:hypothetical protein